MQYQIAVLIHFLLFVALIFISFGHKCNYYRTKKKSLFVVIAMFSLITPALPKLLNVVDNWIIAAAGFTIIIQVFWIIVGEILQLSVEQDSLYCRISINTIAFIVNTVTVILASLTKAIFPAGKKPGLIKGIQPPTETTLKHAITVIPESVPGEDDEQFESEQSSEIEYEDDTLEDIEEEIQDTPKDIEEEIQHQSTELPKSKSEVLILPKPQSGLQQQEDTQKTHIVPKQSETNIPPISPETVNIPPKSEHTPLFPAAPNAPIQSNITITNPGIESTTKTKEKENISPKEIKIHPKTEPKSKKQNLATSQSQLLSTESKSDEQPSSQSQKLKLLKKKPFARKSKKSISTSSVNRTKRKQILQNRLKTHIDKEKKRIYDNIRKKIDYYKGTYSWLPHSPWYYTYNKTWEYAKPAIEKEFEKLKNTVTQTLTLNKNQLISIPIEIEYIYRSHVNYFFDLEPVPDRDRKILVVCFIPDPDINYISPISVINPNDLNKFEKEQKDKFKQYMKGKK